MESHGEPGSIQITEAMAARLGDAFVCEPRGEVAIKGKGVMRTFFLRGQREGASAAQPEPAASASKST